MIILFGDFKFCDVTTTKEKSPDLTKQKLLSIAEIKLAGYFAEHNITFLGADHLSDLLKDIIPDSNTAKQINADVNMTQGKKVVNKIKTY